MTSWCGAEINKEANFLLPLSMTKF